MSDDEKLELQNKEFSGSFSFEGPLPEDFWLRKHTAKEKVFNWWILRVIQRNQSITIPIIAKAVTHKREAELDTIEFIGIGPPKWHVLIRTILHSEYRALRNWIDELKINFEVRLLLWTSLAFLLVTLDQYAKGYYWFKWEDLFYPGITHEHLIVIALGGIIIAIINITRKWKLAKTENP